VSAQSVIRNEIRPADRDLAVLNYFDIAAKSLVGSVDILNRMPEHCSPDVFYGKLRTYLAGWSNAGGIVFDGVTEYEGVVYNYNGGSGAQSTLFPLLDAALGISHSSSVLKGMLADNRKYMPRNHVTVLDKFEAGPSLREWILSSERNAAVQKKLIECFDGCVDSLADFRRSHIRITSDYIVKMGKQRKEKAFTGTGGSPFMVFLMQHLKDTAAVRIVPPASDGSIKRFGATVTVRREVTTSEDFDTAASGAPTVKELVMIENEYPEAEFAPYDPAGLLTLLDLPVIRDMFISIFVVLLCQSLAGSLSVGATREG
jgi:hypothetical protein